MSGPNQGTHFTLMCMSSGIAHRKSTWVEVFRDARCSLGFLRDLDVPSGDFDSGFGEIYPTVFIHAFNFESRTIEETAYQHPYKPANLEILQQILRQGMNFIIFVVLLHLISNV